MSDFGELQPGQGKETEQQPTLEQQTRTAVEHHHEEETRETESPDRETVARLLSRTRTELGQASESEARSREETGRWIAGILPEGLAEILKSRPDISVQDAQRILAKTSLHYSKPYLPSNILSFVRHNSAEYLNNAVSLNVGPTAASILINGTYQEGPNGPLYVWESELPKSRYGSKRHLHAELNPANHTVSIKASLPGGQELYNITIPGSPSEVDETNSSSFSSTEYFGPRGQFKQTRKPFEKPSRAHKKRDGRVWDYATVLTRAAHDVALTLPENSRVKSKGLKAKAA